MIYNVRLGKMTMQTRLGVHFIREELCSAPPDRLAWANLL